MKTNKKLLKERIDLNLWDNIDSVIKVINDMRAKKWLWVHNPKCKYIEVRIDMRDGGCIISDRDGNRILPEDLEHQYKYNGKDN